MIMPVEIAINLLLALLDHASAISQLIQAAKANGQTNLTPEQWKVITDADDAAKAALTKAIADAGGAA
jgi:hypothetical protein